MKIHELQRILNEENFEPSTYSLNGGESDEVFCLSYEEPKWYVYYSERGLQTGKIGFETEGAACDYFLQEMRSDPMTRRGWKSGFPLPPLKKTD